MLDINIKERLNKGVANEEWLRCFLDAVIHHLSHSSSDHCPIWISLEPRAINVRQRSFKFEPWWKLEEYFEQEVSTLWQTGNGDIVDRLAHLRVGLMT